MDSLKILESLTIDEKLRLLNGEGAWHTEDFGGKIPTVMMSDGPHGLRKEKAGTSSNEAVPATCFPTASAIASSFNPDCAYEMAEAIAKEASKEEVSIVLGCGVNIKRSPLCGRNFEYFSEDPYLAGKMGTAYIKGMQDNGIGTSLKHFAGNSQEKRRMTSNSEIDERALREIYLRAFEMIVKDAHPTTIMASYNRLNGDFACANKHLLTDILRNEWGFDGAVISDWGAAVDIVKCMKAGLTLEMPDSQMYHTNILKKAYEDGEITEEEINTWALNVLEKIVYLNEKEFKYKEVDFEAQNDIARRIEDECAVLLKNNGVLPLKKDYSLILIGEMAEKMRFQGGGSSHINVPEQKNAIETLKAKGFDVTYFKGYTSSKDVELTEETIKVTNYLKDLKKENDKNVILYFMGLTDYIESEGFDREDLLLPANQISLLKEIKKVTSLPIVAVTFGGAPMDYSFEKYVDGILHMHLGGQAVAESVADLLSGAVNPSGRLSETIPLKLEDTPAYRYFGKDSYDVEYRESIFTGYRYYETFDIPVKYPFGYGLSYTSFEYSNLTIGGDAECPVVEFDLTNTGSYAGAEVSQVYVCPSKQDFIRASKELRGFEKTYLSPGETKHIKIELDDRSFFVFSTDTNVFKKIGGSYKIAVGSSVKDIKLSKIIEVLGEKYYRNERELFPSYFALQDKGMEIDKKEFEKLYGRKLSDLDGRKAGEYDLTMETHDIAKKSLFGKAVLKKIDKQIEKRCEGLSEDDSARKMNKTVIYETSLESMILLSGGGDTVKLSEALLLAANKNTGKAIARVLKKK